MTPRKCQDFPLPYTYDLGPRYRYTSDNTERKLQCNNLLCPYDSTHVPLYGLILPLYTFCYRPGSILKSVLKRVHPSKEFYRRDTLECAFVQGAGEKTVESLSRNKLSPRTRDGQQEAIN